MIDSEFIKIELGCGKTKSEGYIGIDRFPMEGVDIVADLEKGIPFQDNSVDVVLAVHSLEHFNDLTFIINEIYRVCKNKAIINIISPYYDTTTNKANIFHKQVFNEDTFRFFSCNPVNEFVNNEEFYCPHAIYYGLNSSDNSKGKLNLKLVNMEFFYYKGYRKYSEDIKRNIRKSLNNVCDQLYYTLIVDKSETGLTYEELNCIKANAIKYEPTIIQALRQRDTMDEQAITIIDDILNFSSEKLQNELIEYSFNIENKYNKIYQNIDDVSIENKELINKNKELINKNTELINKNTELINKNTELINKNTEFINIKLLQQSIILKSLLLEDEKKHQLKNKLFGYVKKKSKVNSLKKDLKLFYEKILLCNNKMGKKSILTMSSIIPSEGYVEYELTGYGNKVIFLISSIIGGKVLVEIVQKSQIIKQVIITVSKEEECAVEIPEMSNKIYVRFRAIEVNDIIQVLEIVNKKKLFFCERDLAAYIE